MDKTTEAALEIIQTEIENVGHRIGLLALSFAAFTPEAVRDKLAEQTARVADELGKLHAMVLEVE